MKKINVSASRILLIGALLVLAACGGEDVGEVPSGGSSDSIISDGSTLSPADNPTNIDDENYLFPAVGNIPEGSEQSVFEIPNINEFGGQNSARKPLRGEFTVSDTGDPVYSLMIDLPPAVADFTPELGLRYIGSTEVGSLRNGWSVIGYSEITKCPATQRVDGFTGTVKGQADERQRFCLDGEPLILVSGGEYGAAGTEYVTQKKSRSRIMAFGSTESGPEYFELKTGDGTTKIFGQNKDAKLEFVSNGSGVKQGYAWKIDRVLDPSGNEVDYEYSGYRLPQFIFYQGKADGARSVRVYFEWEASKNQWINQDFLTPEATDEALNPIEVRNSLGDRLYSDQNRLKEIQIAVGYRNNLAYDEAYYYHFEYDDRLNTDIRGLPPKALLKKIFRCQDTTSGMPEPRCSKPVVLEWGYDYQLESELARCDLPSERMWPGGAQYFSGHYKNSSPLVDNFGYGGGNYYSHVLADFNNDDNVDVAVMYTFADGANSRMNAWVAYANGDGTYRDSNVRYSEIIGASGIINNRLAGDFNNDGMADLVAANASEGGWNAYVAMNLGNNTFAKPAHYHLSSENFEDHRAYRQITGDFNGDGNLDLMIFNLGNGILGKVDVIFNPVPGLVAYVALGNGDGTFQHGMGRQLISYRDLVNFEMRERGLFTADFNNDGITDIGSIFFNRDPNTFLKSYVGYETVVAFGQESGEFTDPVVQRSSAFSGQTPPGYSEPGGFRVADINGDGLADLLAILDGGNLNVLSFIGKGDGTFEMRNFWNAGRARGVPGEEGLLRDPPST